MRIVEPGFEVMARPSREETCKLIERVGRVCYKSEDKITDDSCYEFVKMLVRRKHYAMLEHVSVTVRWVVDRGTSHALVRHRIGAFAQESTIYCDYMAGKFGSEIAVIRPTELDPADQTSSWALAVDEAEYAYKRLRSLGVSPKIARAVLPTCTKTELVTTFNLRQWMHVFEARLDPMDHPLTRKITGMLLDDFKAWLPEVFANVGDRNDGHKVS